MKQPIKTDQAPRALGPYSQAIKVNNTVYLAGQIPLDPKTEALVSEDFAAQAKQVFANLQAVCQASGGDINNLVKLTIFLTDLQDFSTVNEIMKTFFKEPYPVRTTIEVAKLPKACKIEIDGILVI